MKPAEEYILNQAEPFKSMLLHLQVIIEATLPEVELLFKWRVPFYYVGKSPICYLNVTKGYVDVGFWGAQYFTDHADKLVADKRKYVKSFRYRKPEEIDEQVFVTILQQAYTYRNEKFITD
ncbi:DUF1801 domain-containing protein [Aquimarina sp. BL5]|uniref:DUF1801 domain-containing protein n=1 Tax=Aquimarina sp. BL5 TaxID=1714860 RepID=UPI000E53B6DA|nr:DUF1801 domain-containing protein [Aquimarina sp. BL5]AXT50911.1 DUF1801 domain-containing protein [Aquimarina sp. BL5]RKN05609.1 DUF1801 domain-containing protein [Aquimarina sp. BL5]